MKLTISIFLLILLFGASAQTDICQRDTTSAYGKLLTKIIDESQSGVTIRHSNSMEEFNARRICQHSYQIIDSLNDLLNNEQAEELFTCDNPVLKSVGFIIYCKRNDKENFINKFRQFLNQRTGFMTSGCSDAIRTISFQQYCFEILNHQNLLYKPQFRLAKKEEKKLTNELLDYEDEFWKN